MVGVAYPQVAANNVIHHVAMNTLLPAEEQTQDLHRVNLRGFLRGMHGKFVTLDFIKADGSERALNGRLSVRKYVKGGPNTVEAPDRPHLVVYDVKAKGYRAVNLATVSEVRAKHTRFRVIG